MQLVLLTGFKRLDFSPKDEPDKRIKGYNVFLCAKTGEEKDGVYGVMPISDGGKRFLGDALCEKLGVDRTLLTQNLYDFFAVEFDINGKFTSFRALTEEEKKKMDDYPF